MSEGLVGDAPYSTQILVITSRVLGTFTNSLIIYSIAKRDSSAGYFPDGLISNVSIWNSAALTSAQVTEIYNQGLPR